MFSTIKGLLIGLIATGFAGCSFLEAESLNDSGEADIQVTDAGNATCITTSSGINNIGAVATNLVRGEAGLPLVRPNQTLARAAAAHACDMAKSGRMTHVGSSSSGAGVRVTAFGYAPLLTAENIAAGNSDLDEVLDRWNHSPRHLKNILLPELRDFGIGKAIAEDGETVFWAAVYSAPR